MHMSGNSTLSYVGVVANMGLLYKQTKDGTSIDVMEYLAMSQKTDFEAIKTLSELRENLEARITAILSDYTQMINQASVVSTLTLAMATAAFGSLLGNTENQTEWKSTMFAISCVITVCLSIMSVIESFFLSIHINQVEARFAGGVYPHINQRSDRVFNSEELKNLNAKFNFVVVTFFGSFLSFSTTVLSTMYIGLGLSEKVFDKDVRIVKDSDSVFVNDTRFSNGMAPLHNLEPNYVQTATTLTIIVGITYFILLFRFFSTYSNHIYGRSLLRFLVICGCMQPKGKEKNEDILTPIEIAAERFNDLQKVISEHCVRWLRSSTNLIEFIRLLSKNEISVFQNRNQRKKNFPEFRVDISKENKNFVKTYINKVSSWTTRILDTFEEYIPNDLTPSEIKKQYACKNHIAELHTNIAVIEQYQISERCEGLNELSYKLEPWARVITFLILIWGISGGVVLTILFFVLGLILVACLNLCPCCRNADMMNPGRQLVNLSSLHFEWLYKLYQEQVQINPDSSANTTDQSATAASNTGTSNTYVRSKSHVRYPLITF